MSKLFRNDWVGYWAKYDDPAYLRQKSVNIDATLREIEQELNLKLLSGDQLQVIDALEDRLKSVNKRRKSTVPEQASLFE